jgi:long-chain acyl-CoA synthetase
MTLYDLFQARVDAAPDAVAIRFADERTTYRQLAAEVDRIARGLHALGVETGDRVLMYAGNSPAVLIAYLAAARLGAVFAPVNASFREREGRYILANARPRAAVVEASLLDQFGRWPEGGTSDLVVLAGADERPTLTGGATWFHELGRGCPPAPVAHLSDEAPVLLCYTSGTTSTPKPVLHSHRSEIYNAQTYAAVWGLTPEDRGIVALPITWVFGLSTTSMALLTSGGTVVLAERFHPVRVLEAIASHRASAMWGTMSMYSKLLEVLKRGSADLSSLRVVVNGGEPCPPSIVQEFESWTGIRLLGSYATSEVRPVLAERPGGPRQPEGSAGQLVPAAEILLEDAEGNEVPAGEPGHALLRCPGMLTEYYREPGLTADRLTTDGWFRSGDILRRDADGHYFVVGRQTDMIIRSGVNVAPAEVESALLAHRDIVDAAVVGIPDPRSGEAIRAYIVLEGDAATSAEDIRDAAAIQLAAYKVPQEVIFLDAIPRTATGKLDRGALRRGRDAPTVLDG